MAIEKSKLREQLRFLDGLRGLAALYVLIHHARWLLWEGYNVGYLAHPESYGTLQKLAMYALSAFKFGHEAVLLFFVLSGFVIHLRYAIAIDNEGGEALFGFFGFLKRRIRRIYPPLLLALVVTVGLDQFGMQWFSGLYEGSTLYPSLNNNIPPEYSWLHLGGNLLFLMDIYTPVWGTNGPLWSLAYEWWFYMAYPLFFYVSRKNVWWPFFLLILLAVVAVQFPEVMGGVVLLKKIFSLMIIWWLGAFLADVYVGRVKLSFGILSPFVIVLLLMPFEVIKAGPYDQHLWGLGFFGLFALLFYLQSKRIELTWLHRLKLLGDFSYSLYVLHMPLMVLGSAWLIQRNGQLPAHFGYVTAGIVAGLALGYLGYLIAERPVLKRKSK